jgi:hypothetical protein
MKWFKIREVGVRENVGFGLNVGNYYNDHEECFLHIRFLKWSLWIDIPKIIKPHRAWKDAEDDEYWTQRGGGYWTTTRREYGVDVDARTIVVKFGTQQDCWPDDRRWSYYFPWMETRRVRYDFLDALGNLVVRVKDKPSGAIDFDAIEVARGLAPKYRFAFNDYDGEEILATCRVEEMEWRYGTKWCKWVGWLAPKIVRRTLDIEFNKEVGPGKGSWKGGTMGHGIDLLPNESPYGAFVRYGKANDRKFTNIRVA